MRLATRLFLAQGSSTPPVPVFDPATLPLAAWFEAGDLVTGSGATWTGKASTGISGSTDAYISGSNNIGYGVTLNGHQTMRVAATTNTFRLWATDHTTRRGYADMSQLSGGSVVACTMWALVNMVSPLTTGTGVQGDPSLLGPYVQNMNGVMGAAISSVNKLEGYGYFNKVPKITTTPATWLLAQYRFNQPAGYVEIRIDGGSWTQVSGVSVIFNDTGTDGQWIICNGTNSTPLPCDIASVGVSAGILADADLDNVRAYLNDRYALAL